MKKQLGGLVLLWLAATTGFASHQQRIELCTNINSFDSPFQFRAAFDSSDILDGGSETVRFSENTSCINHTYRFGPKNISLTIKTYSPSGESVKIMSDKSCGRMHKIDSRTWKSDYMKTYGKNVSWMMYIHQIGKEGNTYLYYVSCERREV